MKKTIMAAVLFSLILFSCKEDFYDLNGKWTRIDDTGVTETYRFDAYYNKYDHTIGNGVPTTGTFKFDDSKKEIYLDDTETYSYKFNEKVLILTGKDGRSRQFVEVDP